MLSVLRMKNLVLVEEREVELSPAMNVMTGETGAGKSILLKGIQLLGGRRASADVIRSGAERCEIEGLFVLPEEQRAILVAECPWTEELLGGEDELLVRRVIDQSGRGKITLNGRLCTLGELQQVAELLVDVTGQHEQHTLFDPYSHRELLDQFGVEESLIESVRSAFQAWNTSRKLFEEFRTASAAKQEHFRRLSLERDELKKAKLRVGERLELMTELKRVESFEVISQSLSEAQELLDDRESGVLRQLSQLVSRLDLAADKEEKLKSAAELAVSAEVQLKELRFQLNDFSGVGDLNPAELERMRERLSELSKLERRYGRVDDDLVSYFKTIDEEVSAFESGAFDEERLKKELTLREKELRQAEEKLTAARKSAGEKLSNYVQPELQLLNLKQARFITSVTPAESTADGADRVEFLFSANPGEEPRPMQKVASGGELSRVLLVLKTILNEEKPSVLQVFDEIDTGIGGAVAQTVGEKIRGLTPRYQVILVTHAPQIAALGHKHFLIEKSSTETSSTTTLRELGEQERVGEIARMLAGKTVTKEFEASARELLRVEGKNEVGNTEKRRGRRGVA